jgi:hypothetical protein
MVQPVTLNVGEKTGLLLEAWRDSQGTGHTVYARLVDGGGSPLGGQAVTLNVNGTAYALQTNQSAYQDQSGYVTLYLTLQPGDAGAANAYQVMAMFNGTNPRSANLTAEDPYGDQYAVCTTIQYDLRPSTNSSTLAVLLQSTDAITAAKTAEQMQQQAQDSGWISVYSEWSWWYPWYRLHVKIDVNPTIDVGFSPVLPGGETYSWDGLGFFSGLTGEVISDVVLDFAGLFTTFFIARHASMVPIVGAGVGLAIELGKIAVQSTLLYFTDWQNRGSGLLGVAIGNVLMGILALKASIAEAFIRDLMRLCKWVASALMNMFDALARILEAEQWASRWWIDGIEAGGDFALAALGMARYAGYL